MTRMDQPRVQPTGTPMPTVTFAWSDGDGQ